MKERTGLDCIGHLGDVLFERTNGPTPQMSDWLRREKTAEPAKAAPTPIAIKRRKRSRLSLLLGVSTAE